MIETFNRYQQRIQELLQRERAFNRYTSHELRTPLMIMRGACDLLKLSQEPAFVEKQRQRLYQASVEMSEFTETLLSLSQTATPEERILRPLQREELEAIVQQYRHLQQSERIEIKIDMKPPVSIEMPSAAFHILVGNLLKNAFANTSTGYIHLGVDAQQLRVEDSGHGLSATPPKPQGFGLGLLLVKDLCHRYDWQFELCENDNNIGCSARVTFASTPDEH